MYETHVNRFLLFVLQGYGCNHNHLITSIVRNLIISNPHAVPCDQIHVGTNEELVLTVCNVTSSDMWRRGANVCQLVFTVA